MKAHLWRLKHSNCNQIQAENNNNYPYGCMEMNNLVVVFSVIYQILFLHAFNLYLSLKWFSTGWVTVAVRVFIFFSLLYHFTQVNGSNKNLDIDFIIILYLSYRTFSFNEMPANIENAISRQIALNIFALATIYNINILYSCSASITY